MSLSLDDVQRIAHLARLALAPAEAQAMQQQLNGFFSIVDRMSAVDTSGVQPLYTPLAAVAEVQLRLREDAVTEPATAADRQAHLANAPATADGLLLVPRVIE